MLFNNSPVKSISEKLKSPQASIKNLKFEREKDFKSFLKYIEREAKELDKIKLPPRNEIEKKSGGGLGALLGLGAIGLLSLFGGGKGGDGNQYAYGDRGSGNVFRMPPIGRDRKREDDSDEKRELDFDPKGPTKVRKNLLSLGLGQLNKQFAANAAEINEIEINKQRSKKSFKFEEQQKVAANVIKKESSASAIIDPSQKQFGAGRGRGIKIGGRTIDLGKFLERVKKNSKKISKEGFNPNVEITEDTVNALIKIGKATRASDGTPLFKDSGGKLRPLSALNRNELKDIMAVQKFTKDYEISSDLFPEQEIIIDKNLKNIKPRKLNLASKIAADFSKPTLGINVMESFISKVGLGKKTNLFGMNPKGMSIFKFSSFSKGKTGLMVLDFGLTAMELYDSLRKVRPRSNIGASLLDLVGINLNNFVADLMNNPSMLREYVSVTNDPRAINANKNREIINQNIRKIKEIKKKDFTGDDITEGAIGTKQFINNLGKVLSNPNTYNFFNPFAQVVPQPNPELFQSPSGESSYDNILGIFQVNTLEGGG